MYSVHRQYSIPAYWIVYVLLLTLCTTFSFAAEIHPDKDHTIVSFGTENGLPDDYVSGVLIDNAGFIWLTTNTSLVRYDGVQFKRYSIKNERITGFFQSFSGDSIYLRTPNYCYTIYNGRVKLNTWIHNTYNLCFLQSRIAYHLNSVTKKAITQLKEIIQDPHAIYDCISHYFFPVSDTSFYCRLKNGTYLFFDGKKFKRIGKIDPILEPVILVYKKELYYFNPEAKISYKSSGDHFIPVKVDPEAWKILRSPLSAWHKYHYYFLINKQCYSFEVINGIVHTKPVFSVQNISQLNDFKYSSRFNAYFIASSNGFKIQSKKYFHHITDPKSKNIVRAFIELEKGQLIAPENFIIPERQTILPYQKMDLLALFIDKEKKLYYSSERNLFYYDSKNNTIRNIDSVIGSLTHMTYDQYGNLYYSDMFSISKLVNKKTTPQLVFRIGTQSFSIFKFLILRNQSMLIATSKGLYLSNPQKTKTIISNAEVRELYEDSLFVLVGTYGKGAYLYDKTTEKVVRIPNDQSNSLDYTHCVLPDTLGDLWISTNNGIIRIPRKSLLDFKNGKSQRTKWSHYTRTDGLENLEMNGGSSPCGITSGDHFYFASMKGIVVFNPYQIPIKIDSSSLFIEGIIADGNEYEPEQHYCLLPSGTKQLKFVIASPSILNTNNSEISYRIKQLDTNWILLPKTMEINLLGLPNGSYDLEIKKELTNLPGLVKTVYLHFDVELYYYQTWWFKVLIGLIGLLIITVIIILRGQLLKRQNILLNQKVREQTHRLTRINQQNDVLISVLAHDIRSPIKSMEFLTTCIQHEHPNDTSLLSLTSTLLQSIKKIDIYSTNHLTWYSILKGSIEFETRLINLADLIEEVIRFHAVSIEKNGIILHKIIPEKIIVNSNYNGLFTVLTNLIDNAIKYSFDRKIRIELLDEQDDVRIRISNPIHPDYIDGFNENIQYISAVNWELEEQNITKKLGMRIVSFINYKLGLGLRYEITPEHDVVVSIKIPKPN